MGLKTVGLKLKGQNSLPNKCDSYTAYLCLLAMASTGLVDLFGEELLGKAGTVKTVEALNGKTNVMIYFSAHWCPPCRGFTPTLAAAYKKGAQGKNVEVVFVSSDRDEAGFGEYYGEMPWLALPFSDKDR